MAGKMSIKKVLRKVKEFFIIGKVTYKWCEPKEVFGHPWMGVSNDYVLIPKERISRITNKDYDFYMIRTDPYNGFIIEGVNLDRIQRFIGLINIDFGKSLFKYVIYGEYFRVAKDAILFITKLLDRVYDCEGEDYSFTEIAKGIIKEYEDNKEFYSVDDVLCKLSEITERPQCYYNPDTDELEEWTEPVFYVEKRKWEDYRGRYMYRVYITYNKPDLMILFDGTHVAVVEKWSDYWWDKRILREIEE